LIADKEVVLAKDVSETDKYGRLLRYVYLEDKFVNNIMMKEGYARISTFPPDVKFKDQFLTSEREARDAKVGLWSACN
jgi:micrococcal nuclease